MAVAVAAPVVIGLSAEAGGGAGGDGCGAPLGVARSEVPPPVEGVPVAVTAGGKGKDEEKKREKKEMEKGQGFKWLGHYSSAQDILLVGDGDFSFSLALATAFGSGANLVATSLDTYETLKSKYSKAESNLTELKRLSATVLHGVDTKEMKSHPDLKNRRFDRIVFNFPHAGFKGKEDDMHMINLHKELLWGFFFNARHLVWRYGEIHVTHKTGYPYDRWDLEHLASGSSLAMVEKVAFRKEDYPGYNQKRGDSARCDEPFDLGACCTFKFQIGDLKKLKKMKGQRAGSIPSLGWSNIHWQHFPPPGNTGSMLIPLPPYIADQRPQPSFPPNSDGMMRAPYFPQHDSFHPMVTMQRPWLNALPNPDGINGQDSFHPMLSMPEPWPNALPDQGDIHQQESFHPMANMPWPGLNALPPPGGLPPPMSRIPRPDLHAPHEQHCHWYRQRTVPDQLGGDNYFAAREYEMQRQVIPGATGLNHSTFLGHHPMDRESVQKLEWLRWMVAQHGRP